MFVCRKQRPRFCFFFTFNCILNRVMWNWNELTEAKSNTMNTITFFSQQKAKEWPRKTENLPQRFPLCFFFNQRSKSDFFFTLEKNRLWINGRCEAEWLRQKKIFWILFSFDTGLKRKDKVKSLTEILPFFQDSFWTIFYQREKIIIYQNFFIYGRAYFIYFIHISYFLLLMS